MRTIRDRLTYVKRKVKKSSLTYVTRLGTMIGVSPTRLPAEFRAYLAKIGRKGGKKGGVNRAARMTQEERSASARKAVQARWAKTKATS